MLKGHWYRGSQGVLGFDGCEFRTNNSIDAFGFVMQCGKGTESLHPWWRCGRNRDVCFWIEFFRQSLRDNLTEGYPAHRRLCLRFTEKVIWNFQSSLHFSRLPYLWVIAIRNANVVLLRLQLLWRGKILADSDGMNSFRESWSSWI